MGYKSNNEYIIENDVEDTEELSFKKEMKRAADANNGLPEGYEIDEPVENPNLDLQKELQEEAKKEGLVSDEEYLGGKGASPEEVINAMREEGLSKGAQEKKKNMKNKHMKTSKQ